MSSTAPKVLVIGSGLTGSLCAHYLRQQNANLAVEVWDKARGAGGRMTTTRHDLGNKADLGAQYVSSNKKILSLYSEEYQALLKENILRPLNVNVEGMKNHGDDVEHFVAPGGMSTIVKHFLLNSSAQVTLNNTVLSIAKADKLYKVETTDGKSGLYSAVVSTIPIPQLLSIKGIDLLLSDETKLANLRKVKYSSRFVLIWFYKKDASFPDQKWGSKYLDDEIFRYVTFDNIKRGQQEEPHSVVFHTSIAYGEKYQSKPKVEMEEELSSHAKSLFPDWPQPMESRCHKWLYSQVVSPYPNKPGCLTISTDPTLVLAGDAFTESNVNGCIESARAAAKQIVACLGKS